MVVDFATETEEWLERRVAWLPLSRSGATKASENGAFPHRFLRLCERPASCACEFLVNTAGLRSRTRHLSAASRSWRDKMVQPAGYCQSPARAVFLLLTWRAALRKSCSV